MSWGLLTGALAAAALLGASCSDSGPVGALGDGQPYRSAGGTRGDEVVPSGCDQDGMTESCSVILDKQGTIITCAHGERTCTQGKWSECSIQKTQSYPWDGEHDQPGLGWQSLSNSTKCTNNPCDPYCWNYQETPTEDGGIQPDGSYINQGWDQGSLADYPSGLVTKGLNEPCSSGFECQFDHYCKNPIAGSCAHDLCTTGTRLAANCNACASAVCGVIPGCCASNGSWSASCVAKAREICNIDCGAGPAGQCYPYDPGAVNAQCAGNDFTVAPPCGTRVPVCNRGKTTAPAGVKVHLYAANSQQYPLCAPNLNDSTHKGVCQTNKPIPPGQCVMIEDCPFGNANNFTLVVNPSSDPAALPECTCQDNWSLYNKDEACGKAPCASVVNEAVLSPLAMMVMLDRSGSMATGIGGNKTRWSASVSALTSFFQDSGSAGIRPAFHSFPYSGVGSCASGNCLPAPCADPIVEAAPLLASSGSSDPQETALVNALNALGTGGGTPTLPALQGSIQWAVGYMNSHPGEKAIVVLVTDGEPNGCSSTVNSVKDAAAAGLAQGVRTYVIGVAGVAQSTIQTWATAGGGQAFFVSGQNISTEFLAAMKSIQAQAASCDLVWAPGANFDPTKASVIYTPSNGVPATLPKRNDASTCGNQAGWYYDNNTTPSKITLCTSTCNTVKQDTGAKVELSIGCPLQYEPRTYGQTYLGSCPSGTRVEWKYLTYDTLTPDDSNITFRVRTADSQALLSSATFVQAAVAKASPNTQKCGLTGPAPCPIGLATVLGGKPKSTNQVLELSMTLNPSSNKLGAPALKSWDVTYDCLPSE